MSYNLYTRTLAVLAMNPALRPYKGRLFGTCCQHPTDAKLKPRLAAFVLQHPEFKGLIQPLLEG